MVCFMFRLFRRWTLSLENIGTWFHWTLKGLRMLWGELEGYWFFQTLPENLITEVWVGDLAWFGEVSSFSLYEKGATPIKGGVNVRILNPLTHGDPIALICIKCHSSCFLVSGRCTWYWWDSWQLPLVLWQRFRWAPRPSCTCPRIRPSSLWH